MKERIPETILNDNLITNSDYDTLIQKWKEYKEIEKLGNEGRLKIEKLLIEMVGDKLREKGINHLPNDLDITTGLDEKWEQAEIEKLALAYDEKLLPVLPFFPFDRIWQPNSKKLAIIKESSPDKFKMIFRHALTIKPKKPSFSIKNK